MITFSEKIIFILAVLASLYAAGRIAVRIKHTIERGQGKIDYGVIPGRLASVFATTIIFNPVFRFRFWPSLFHAFVGWAFFFYILVNLGDVLQAFIPDYSFLGTGSIGNIYRLTADVLSVAALTGMIALIIRRFLLKPATLTTRKDVLLSCPSTVSAATSPERPPSGASRGSCRPRRGREGRTRSCWRTILQPGAGWPPPASSCERTRASPPPTPPRGAAPGAPTSARAPARG